MPAIIAVAVVAAVGSAVMQGIQARMPLKQNAMPQSLTLKLLTIMPLLLPNSDQQHFNKAKLKHTNQCVTKRR